MVDNVGGALFNEVLATLGYGGAFERGRPERRRSPEFQYGGAIFQAQSDRGVCVLGFSAPQAQAAWKDIKTGNNSEDYWPEAGSGSRFRI